MPIALPPSIPGSAALSRTDPVAATDAALRATIEGLGSEFGNSVVNFDGFEPMPTDGSNPQINPEISAQIAALDASADPDEDSDSTDTSGDAAQQSIRALMMQSIRG